MFWGQNNAGEKKDFVWSQNIGYRHKSCDTMPIHEIKLWLIICLCLLPNEIHNAEQCVIKTINTNTLSTYTHTHIHKHILKGTVD